MILMSSGGAGNEAVLIALIPSKPLKFVTLRWGKIFAACNFYNYFIIIYTTMISVMGLQYLLVEMEDLFVRSRMNQINVLY